MGLADAIYSWEDGPGEEAPTALEGNSRVQNGWSGRWRVDSGWAHPLHLTDSSLMERTQRRTRWGLCGNQPFPKGNGHMAEEMPLGEDGKDHASRGRGQNSYSCYSRHWVSHTLIQGLQGEGALKNGGEKDCFSKENWTTERIF